MHTCPDRAVHYAVVVSEQIERGAEVFAEPGPVGERVGEECPDEGDEGSARYTG